MNRPTISAVIITKDEEKDIERCLSSISWADEVIVVDSESSDKTIELAKKFTSRVYSHPWEGYGRQKNFAVSLADCEWVLNIDSDEVISGVLREEILNALSNPGSYSGFYIPRKNFIGSRVVRFGGWSPDYTLRLFKKDSGKFEDRLVHEKISVDGKTGYLKTPLLHYTYRDLKDYAARQDWYARLAAEEISKKNKKVTLFGMVFRACYNFLKSYILRLGFLDGSLGLLVSVHSSIYVFKKYKYLRKNYMDIDSMLIREANWLGDAVMSMPLLMAVHEQYPDAKMTIAARKSLLPLFDLLPWEVIKIPIGGIGAWCKLRKEKFDLAIILPNSFRSALEVFLTGSHIRIGYSTAGRGIFLTERVSVEDPGQKCPAGGQRQADYYFNLLTCLGIKGNKPQAKLIVKDKYRMAGAALLRKNNIDTNKPLVVVSPGASFGEAKCWPEENFASLVKKIKGRSQIIFIGTERDSPVIERIISYAGENAGITDTSIKNGYIASDGKVVPVNFRSVSNLAGKTTPLDLAGIFLMAKLVISNDNGSMHLASILGAPLIAIFGPTEPLRTGPLGEKTVILHEKADCSPCKKRVCRQKKCFNRITVDMVYSRVTEFI